MSSYSVHARPVLFVIGLLLVILSLAEIIPAAADIMEQSGDWLAFAESSAATMFVGIVLCLATYSPGIKLSLRQGFLLTVAAPFAAALHRRWSRVEVLLGGLEPGLQELGAQQPGGSSGESR